MILKFQMLRENANGLFTLFSKTNFNIMFLLEVLTTFHFPHHNNTAGRDEPMNDVTSQQLKHAQPAISASLWRVYRVA